MVFPEGEESKILRPCQILLDEEIAQPILLGREDKIRGMIEELHLHLDGVSIIEPARSPNLEEYTARYYALRQRKGITRSEAESQILNHNTFGAMMVQLGHADALVAGLSQHYPDTIRPALQVIPVRRATAKWPGCTC